MHPVYHEYLQEQHRASGIEEFLAGRSIVFVDSITDLTRQAMAYARQQPEAFSERSGKPDVRGAYVYAWSRRAGFAQVAPVKGVDGFNRASPVAGPTYVDVSEGGKRLRRGARLWTVAVSTFKAETYRFLRLDRPAEQGAAFPPGTVHLPRWADSEWLKQFVAEQLVTVRNKRGFARLEWQKLRERNEALDARVYARAAAWIAGADRWSEATWRDLEQQLGTGEVDPAEAQSGGSNSTAGPAAPSAGMVRRRRSSGRRVITPSYLR